MQVYSFFDARTKSLQYIIIFNTTGFVLAFIYSADFLHILHHHNILWHFDFKNSFFRFCFECHFIPGCAIHTFADDLRNLTQAKRGTSVTNFYFIRFFLEECVYNRDSLVRRSSSWWIGNRIRAVGSPACAIGWRNGSIAACSAIWYRCK